MMTTTSQIQCVLLRKQYVLQKDIRRYWLLEKNDQSQALFAFVKLKIENIHVHSYKHAHVGIYPRDRLLLGDRISVPHHCVAMDSMLRVTFQVWPYLNLSCTFHISACDFILDDVLFCCSQSGCYSELPQTGWINHTHLLLTVLELWKSKVRVPPNWCLELPFCHVFTEWRAEREEASIPPPLLN